MTNEEILLAILENGLSIRQIPLVVVSRFSPSDNFPLKDGDEYVEEVVKEIPTEAEFKRLREKNYYSENFRWEAGKVYRKFHKQTKTPENAGYWMCQQVKNTSSMVSWNIKTDNLAPTLEESVKLFLASK